MTESSKYEFSAGSAGEQLLQPGTIAGWRTEIQSMLNQCLAELRSIESSLKLAATDSSATFDRPEPQQPLAYTERPQASPTSDTEDFDTRLANLKKLLAEKLTNAESADH